MDDDLWDSLDTDFAAIFKYLRTQRRLPAAHLLQHLQDPNELCNVDKQLVKSTVQTLEDDEAEIQGAMYSVDMLHTFFSVHLEEVRAKLKGYRALVAPIRRVPFEVMQEIFLHTDAAERIVDPEDRRRSYPHINRPPLVAQVNRQWRRVALATPKLWSKCTMVFGMNNDRHIKILNLRISRASPLPVSLTIHTSMEDIPLRYEDICAHLDPDPLYDSDDDYPLSMYSGSGSERYGYHSLEYELILQAKKEVEQLAESVIAPNVDRLGSITVLQYSSALEHFVETLRKLIGVNAPPLPPPSLPRLKALTLPQEAWTYDPNPLLDLVPNLERLSISPPESTSASRSPSQQHNIPWTTLVAVRGQLPDSDLQTLFNTSTGRMILAEIAVASFPPRNLRGRGPAPTPAPFKHLASLALQAPDVPEFPALLPPLPSLRHLIFQSDYNKHYNPRVPGPPPVGWALQALALVNAWGSQLEYLGLEFTSNATTVNEVQPDTLDDIIAATPNLEALALPAQWSKHLDRLVPRLPGLVHVEIAPCPIVASTTTTEETTWSVETLAKLDTLCFLASADPKDRSATIAMENTKKVVKENSLKVAISCYRLCPGMRFSSPYFIRKGGVFAQCLLDEEELKSGVRMSTHY